MQIWHVFLGALMFATGFAVARMLLNETLLRLRLQVLDLEDDAHEEREKMKAAHGRLTGLVQDQQSNIAALERGKKELQEKLDSEKGKHEEAVEGYIKHADTLSAVIDQYNIEHCTVLINGVTLKQSLKVYAQALSFDSPAEAKVIASRLEFLLNCCVNGFVKPLRGLIPAYAFECDLQVRIIKQYGCSFLAEESEVVIREMPPEGFLPPEGVKKVLSVLMQACLVIPLVPHIDLLLQCIFARKRVSGSFALQSQICSALFVSLQDPNVGGLCYMFDRTWNVYICPEADNVNTLWEELKLKLCDVMVLENNARETLLEDDSLTYEAREKIENHQYFSDRLHTLIASGTSEQPVGFWQVIAMILDYAVSPDFSKSDHHFPQRVALVDVIKVLVGFLASEKLVNELNPIMVTPAMEIVDDEVDEDEEIKLGLESLQDDPQAHQATRKLPEKVLPPPESYETRNDQNALNVKEIRAEIDQRRAGGDGSALEPDKTKQQGKQKIDLDNIPGQPVPPLPAEDPFYPPVIQVSQPSFFEVFLGKLRRLVSG